MEIDKNECHFKCKAGSFTVEYRGDPAFIIDDLARVVQELLEAAPVDSLKEQVKLDKNTSEPQNNQIQHMSTNTIAGSLGAKSGPDVVMAAIAHIQLVQGRDKASRSEILNEMKKATTFYKSTFGSNLSSYLNSLVRAKRINLVAESTYALTASERSSMQAVMSAN